jgi:nucleoside-diphosphate-sugar epimerase
VKILVTGATGFLGFDLTRKLVNDGHEVVCSVRRTSDTAKLEGLKVSMVYADITDGGTFSDVLASVRPDAVYHCAAKVWDKNEERLFVNNVRGTEEVCGACYRHNIKRLIYLSSVAVVSGNQKTPLTDDMDYKCSDAYGRSKAEAEKIAVSYREKGLNTAIVRPCMVYGEDEPHALANIMRSVMSRRIPILAGPEMDAKLALVYVGNVTDVLRLALVKDEALSGSFMVADKDVITIRKFIEIISDELRAKKPFVIPARAVRAAKALPPVRAKMKRMFKDRVYDISRIVDILGYVPEVSTEEGLRRTARHWKLSQKGKNRSLWNIFPEQDI